MRWRTWLKGLAAAAIGAAANAVVLIGIDPQTFNLGDGRSKLMNAMVAAAAVAVAFYLKKSPLPPDDNEA